MQTPMKRFLSMLVALALIVAMVPASVFAAGETDIFSGWSLTLKDNIGVNFYLAEAAANYTVNVTVAGNEAAYTAVNENGNYVVSVDIAAAQMTDTIGLTVVNGDETVHSGSYTARQYAETILNGDQADYVKQMVKQMLNYGAAAQNYFGYNTENLANSGYETEAVALPGSVDAAVAEGTVTGIAYYGASLLFNSKVAVRFYFVADDISGYTFSKGTLGEKNGMYYVEISDINPQNLNEQIELNVTDGENAITVKYSPMNYIYNKYNSADSSDALKALMQALYGYHAEAQAYILNVEGGVMMQVDGYGWTGETGDLIFKMNNAAPNGGYTPTSEGNIKLIRNGETFDVAYMGQNVITKHNDGWYTLPFWMIVNYKPMLANDILVIEGAFYQASTQTTLHISKTYVLLNEGGTASFSTEMPILPSSYDLGVMAEHPDSNNNWNSGGIYMSHADSDAPYKSDWSLEYYPTSTGSIKRIRNGETIDVAIVGRGTLVKYASNLIYMNINSWTMGANQPAQDGDIYIIEGSFYNEANKATINISKTYIYCNGNNAEFSTEMPTLTTVIDAGVMGKHSSNGWNADALYFSMAENAAPVGDAIRYKPENASNIKLIRDGQTYDVGHNARETIVKASDTGYYIALWTLGDYKPLKANDILIVEGNFINAANKTILNISKSYVLINADGTAEFSTEMPTLTTVIDAGVMNKHSSNGWNGDALYFSMAENAAPVGDAIRYKPENASNIKLIRDGQTYDVGHNARETIVKASDTGYYIALWTLGDYKPLKANDILIVEGNFINAANKTILNISKTYVLINGDGTAEFSTEMPDLGTYVEGGLLIGNENGWTGDGIYFSMNENEAPYNTDWSLRYKPASSDVIKLLRDGNTINIANKDAETLVKYSETNCALATWMFGSYGLKAGDILIVEGDFIYAAENVTLNVQKSYILLNADGSVTVSDTEPVPTQEVDCGVMSEHADGNASEIYFTLAENSIPVDEELVYPYAGTVQLVNGGNTTTVDANIYKLADDQYYLELDGELSDGSYLIVEGAFANEDNFIIMNISKTYVLAEGDSLFYSETEPVPSIKGGMMQAYGENKWSSTDASNPGNLWFALNGNDAPNGSYNPMDAANVKLIRNGETYVVGHTARGTISKVNNDWYVFEFWTIADYKPMVAGDILIVEGNFYQESTDTTLKISKTYVLLNEDGTASYSATEPVPSIKGGMMSAVEGYGWTGGTGALIFKMDNAAPNGGYSPVDAANVKLIRNGETYDVGYVGVNMINKSNDTWYTVEFWTIVNYKPMLANDILVIEGLFKHADSGKYLDISKTYVLLNADGTATFSDTEPVLAINGGMMQAYSDNKWSSTDASNPGNLWFALNGNDAPTGAYRPTDAANVKLIRNGETYVVGHDARDTISKINNDWYVLEFWTIADYKPLKANDILIVEGDFYQASSDTTLRISKTYVLLNADGTATYSDTEPVPEAPSSMMKAYSDNKWSSTDASNAGNLWFALDANDAPTGSYRPTAAANVKLIRNGETYVVGHDARDTISKINNDWYVFEFWTIADHKPMVAGDILIVEGDFYQASSDTTLRISKTYVLLNADGTATYSDTEPVLKPESNHGVMNVTNWQKPASNPDGTANDGGLYFTLAENDVIYTTDWATQFKPVAAENIKLVRNGVETNVANIDANMIIKYSATEYYLQFWPISLKPMQAGDIMIVEGEFKNTSNGSVLNIGKTYILFNENGTVSVYENSPMSIDAGMMKAYDVQNWFDTNYTALYFTMDSNAAPSNADWSVRYMPKDAANIKLIRDGNTINIANTGAETIVKIDDSLYALALDNWWWNAYAPIQDGDILIVEGAFSNAATGYTLNIDKTYINFISKANDEVTFSIASSTEFGDVILPTSNKSVTIGMWNGSHHIFSDARLAELKAAGITKIIGIDPQWIGSENNWDMNYLLDRMQAYGISVVAYARQRTADGSKYSGDDWDGVTVPDYANHPALVGFLMQDEPSAKDFSKLQTLKAQFDAVMPADKLFYVNLYSSSAATSSWSGSVITYGKDYERDYIKEFVSTLDPDVLSWDSYPLLSGKGIRTGYFHNFEIMTDKGVDTWFTLLSAGHDTTSTSYDIPTYEELRWQMAVAMTYGVNNLDHYVYTSHEEDYKGNTMLDYDTQTVTDLYYDVKKADNEIKAWDEIYMAYDWKGTAGVKASNTSTMLDMLDREINLTQNGLSSVSTNRDLLVGVFENNGSKAYMVTNAGSAGTSQVGDGRNYITGDATVTLTLDAADYKCAAVIDQGEITYVAIENNQITLNVDAYEGVFVIPVLN